MKKLIGLCLIGLLLFTGCRPKPITIGFMADLSEKTSQLGVDARNALLLQIDSINDQGGIKGRHIQVVIKDDKGNPDLASQHFTDFKNQDIHFVVGPLTSSILGSSLTHQGDDLLILSPSITSDEATGLDDYFIRTCQLNYSQAQLLSDFMATNKMQDVFIIYNLVNQAYTETLKAAFVDAYESKGGRVIGELGYHQDQTSMKALADAALASGAKHTLIISHAVDTALIQQNIFLADPSHQTLGIQWAMTQDLIENGGRSIDGMYFVGNYKAKSTSDTYRNFSQNFLDRYNYPASFISYWTYDTVQVLLYGLENTKQLSPSQVKATIINKGNFEGIEQDFTIDQFGDANKSYTIYKLTDGEFVPLD